MKKNGLLVLIAVMLLTGCVSARNITEEESEVISTYATHIVLKHDKNFQGNLVDALETSNESKSNEDTSKNMLNEDTSNQNTYQQVETKEESTIPLATALGLSDFQIDFVDFETNKTYGDGSALVMNAVEGASLLIMHFNITNTSSQEKACDILSLSPQFRVTTNNEKTVSTQTTILLNDLGTYIAPIGPGETVGAVLISEKGENYLKDIKSLDLTVTVNGNTSKVTL